MHASPSSGQASNLLSVATDNRARVYLHTWRWRSASRLALPLRARSWFAGGHAGKGSTPMSEHKVNVRRAQGCCCFIVALTDFTLHGAVVATSYSCTITRICTTPTTTMTRARVARWLRTLVPLCLSHTWPLCWRLSRRAALVTFPLFGHLSRLHSLPRLSVVVQTMHHLASPRLMSARPFVEAEGELINYMLESSSACLAVMMCR